MLRYIAQTLSASGGPEERDQGATYLITLSPGWIVKNGFEIWKIQGSKPIVPSPSCVILGKFVNLSEPLS